MKKMLFVGLCLSLILAYSCKKEDVKVKVIEVKEIIMDNSELSIVIGGQEQLSASVVPENSEDKSLVWSSAFERIVSIDQNGLLTAIKEGEAMITVAAKNGIKSSRLVKVIANDIYVVSVSLDKSSLNTNVGDKVNLIATVLPKDATNKKLIWTSSDESIASVDKGIVSCLNVGVATIMVTTDDGAKTSTCTVNVVKIQPKPVSVAIFTNNTDKETSLAFMAVEETFCEIAGKIYSIKKGEWKPESMSVSKSNDKSEYLRETLVIHKKINEGLNPSSFKLQPGESLKIFDQSKICYAFMFDVSSDCDFSGMPELMYLHAGKVNIANMDFRNCIKLDALLAFSNRNIKNVDISNCKLLQYYTVCSTSISKVDFTNCPLLKHAALNDDLIRSVDLSNCPNVGMYTLGGMNDTYYLEDVKLCAKPNKNAQCFFFLNDQAEDYPTNFTIRFHINLDPNNGNLTEGQTQLLSSMKNYLEFDGRYCLEFKAGEPLWRYNKELKLWEQESSDVSIESVSIVGGDFEITAGDTKTLSLNFVPSDVTNKSVSWLSSDNSVAMVLAGVLHTYKAGEIAISVITNNNKENTIKVKVNKANDLDFKDIIGDWDSVKIKFWTPSKDYDENEIKSMVFTGMTEKEKDTKIIKIRESKRFKFTSENVLTMSVMKLDGTYMDFIGEISSIGGNGNMLASFNTDPGKGMSFYGLDEIRDLSEIDVCFDGTYISVQNIYGEYNLDYDLITYFKVK